MTEDGICTRVRELGRAADAGQVTAQCQWMLDSGPRQVRVFALYSLKERQPLRGRHSGRFSDSGRRSDRRVHLPGREGREIVDGGVAGGPAE